MEVGDAGRRDGLDEAQPHVLGQRLEERSAAAEQDRHLVQDHLVDEPRLPAPRSATPPPMRATSLSPAASRAAATASSIPVVTSVCRSLHLRRRADG